MKNHPVIYDRFRTFLAHKNIFTLVSLYIAITIIFSLLVATLWTLVQPNTSNADEFIWKLWYSFVFLYGYQAELSPTYLSGSEVFAVPLSIGSVAFPTLLLGTVVFKILMPKRQIVVFRSKLNLEQSNEVYTLQSIFYIASRLRIINLEIVAYARVLAKRLRHEFPLRTYDLIMQDYPVIPLPYALVPTRVNIPVLVNTDAIDTDQSGAQMIFTVTDKVKLRKVKDLDCITEDGDQCELIFVVKGTFPDLGTDFIETYRYIIPNDINFEEMVDIKTDFDLINQRSLTHGWKNFH